MPRYTDHNGYITPTVHPAIIVNTINMNKVHLPQYRDCNRANPNDQGPVSYGVSIQGYTQNGSQIYQSHTTFINITRKASVDNTINYNRITIEPTIRMTSLASLPINIPGQETMS